MNTLTIKEIRKYPHLQKRQTTSVQKKSGLSLIVENEKNQCRSRKINHLKKKVLNNSTQLTCQQDFSDSDIDNI